MMEHSTVVTVDEAAQQLRVHPKTVLRYIRNGRLLATRVGKSYRIARKRLDDLAGVGDAASTSVGPRATCVVDIPDVSAEAAARLAAHLQAAALGSSRDGPPLHLQTAFDPLAASLKVVVFGSPSQVGTVLELMQVGGGSGAAPPQSPDREKPGGTPPLR
jgi:excisionase family DNA binding protein